MNRCQEDRHSCLSFTGRQNAALLKLSRLFDIRVLTKEKAEDRPSWPVRSPLAKSAVAGPLPAAAAPAADVAGGRCRRRSGSADGRYPRRTGDAEFPRPAGDAILRRPERQHVPLADRPHRQGHPGSRARRSGVVDGTGLLGAPLHSSGGAGRLSGRPLQQTRGDPRLQSGRGGADGSGHRRDLAGKHLPDVRGADAHGRGGRLVQPGQDGLPPRNRPRRPALGGQRLDGPDDHRGDHRRHGGGRRAVRPDRAGRRAALGDLGRGPDRRGPAGPGWPACGLRRCGRPIPAGVSR